MSPMGKWILLCIFALTLALGITAIEERAEEEYRKLGYYYINSTYQAAEYTIVDGQYHIELLTKQENSGIIIVDKEKIESIHIVPKEN